MECQNTDGEFSLTLPLFDNKGKKIKPSEFNIYKSLLNKRFGGSSSIRMSGCYNNDEGKSQCEPVARITSVRDMESSYTKFHKLSCEQRKKLLDEDCTFVKKLGRDAGKEFGQDSIFTTCAVLKNAHLTRSEWRGELPEHKLTKNKKLSQVMEVF